MSITPSTVYPPQPATKRAQSFPISVDKINRRIAYPMGRSIYVRSIDQEQTTPAFQFTKHVHPTTVATFSPSGNYIASGDESGQVKIWDTSISKEKNPLLEQPIVKSEFQILSGPIKSIAWDADNSRVIAVGEGKEKFGHCFSWDSGNSIGEIQGHSDAINKVDIKPQRPYRAATVGNDKAMVFFTGPPFKFDKSLRDYHTNIIRDVKFSPDGKYLISVGSDRLIVIYDGKTGDFIKKIENAHNGGIFGIDWVKDSSKFVTCSADNTLKVWSVDSDEAITLIKIDDETKVENQLVGLAVTDSIIAITLNGNVNFFSMEGKVEKVITGHQSSITSLLIIDGKLVTGSSDGELCAWDIVDNSLSLPTKFADKHENYVVDIVSTEGHLITVGWDDCLKVWKDLTLVTLVKLDSQPKKLLVTGSKISVLFESDIANYSFVGGEVTLDKKQILGYDTSDVDYISEKLLTTNISTNKIEQQSPIDLQKLESKFQEIRATPTVIRVSPDNKYIALGDSTGKYILYNGEDESVKTTRWTFHTSRVIDAKWSPDSKFLLSGGLDCGIMIYSTEKLSKVTKFPLAHQGGITRVEWLSYDDYKATLLTTGLDGAIKVWSVDLEVYK